MNSSATRNKVKKTVIFTDYACNNRCVFCVDADKRSLPGKDTERIKRELSDARARGTTYAEFIGGEVTIRPDVFEILAYAKRLGFETIAMATNGRMLSYSGFAEKLVAAGLNHIIFSIHGDTAALHDSLTASPGSFDQLMTGLQNIRVLPDAAIGSNTTIVKPNYERLPAIGEFLAAQGVRNAEFIFVDPNCGGAKNDFFGLVPRLSEAGPFIRRCLDIGPTVGADHWHVRYVPLCIFPNHLSQVSELDEVKKFKTEHLAPDFENFDAEGSRRQVGRVKPDSCRRCRLDADCEGIWKEYALRYGTDELPPIR